MSDFNAINMMSSIALTQLFNFPLLYVCASGFSNIATRLGGLFPDDTLHKGTSPYLSLRVEHYIAVVVRIVL